MPRRPGYAKSEPGETAATPIPESRPETRADTAPEVTGTIPEPVAKPVTKPVTKQAKKIKHETKRERAVREAQELKDRKVAARKTHGSRERAQRAQAQLRELTPSEKRRLYFQAIEQKSRAEQRRTGRGPRFTDLFR